MAEKNNEVENDLCTIELPLEGELKKCIVVESFCLEEKNYICIMPIDSGTIYFFRSRLNEKDMSMELSEIYDDLEYQKVTEFFVEISEKEIES